MLKKILISLTVILLVLFVGAPAMSFAQEYQPKTAIDKIFEFQIGLGLSDAQMRTLTIVNRTIIQKMVEAKHQADLRKAEIDKFTSNWSSMHGTAVNHIIKEYYDFMTELKRLELEAITKAKTILDSDQLKKFSELSSIETMMIKVEGQLAGMY